MKNEILLPEWNTTPDIFNVYSTTIDKIFKGICDLQIMDSASCKIALNTSSDVKLILKDIQQLKKKTTEPYRHFINVINEAAQQFVDKLDLIQEIIMKKISDYEDYIKFQSEMAQISSEKIFETEDMDISFIVLNDQKIASTSKTIVTHKIEKGFEVVKESLIPREYLMIDEAKIKQAIKMGITNIPGIEIKESKKLILRKR